MIAYDPSEWSDLSVASAGASAALAGLVFVAVSINSERILQFEGAGAVANASEAAAARRPRCKDEARSSAGHSDACGKVDIATS